MSSRVVVYDHTPEVVVAFREGSKKAAKAIADSLAKETSRRSPVGGADDPHAGKLKASWRVEEDRDHFAVVSHDPNAIYQEFGTSKMAAQPSLGPAERTEQRKIGSQVKAILDPMIAAACQL